MMKSKSEYRWIEECGTVRNYHSEQHFSEACKITAVQDSADPNFGENQSDVESNRNSFHS